MVGIRLMRKAINVNTKKVQKGKWMVHAMNIYYSATLIFVYSLV